MHAALLASQLGRHAEAEGAIRSFGFRWRLSPCVWRAARVPPRKVPPPAARGGATAVRSASRSTRLCPSRSPEITRDHPRVPESIGPRVPGRCPSRDVRAAAPRLCPWRRALERGDTAGTRPRHVVRDMSRRRRVLERDAVRVGLGREALLHVVRRPRLAAVAARGRRHASRAPAGAAGRRAGRRGGAAVRRVVGALPRGGERRGGGGRAARLRAPVWPAPPHPSSLRTGVGHELHYDVEEGVLEAGGEVLSPASSPPSSASPCTHEDWSK